MEKWKSGEVEKWKGKVEVFKYNQLFGRSLRRRTFLRVVDPDFPKMLASSRASLIRWVFFLRFIGLGKLPTEFDNGDGEEASAFERREPARCTFYLLFHFPLFNFSTSARGSDPS